MTSPGKKDDQKKKIMTLLCFGTKFSHLIGRTHVPGNPKLIKGAPLLHTIANDEVLLAGKELLLCTISPFCLDLCRKKLFATPWNQPWDYPKV